MPLGLWYWLQAYGPFATSLWIRFIHCTEHLHSCVGKSSLVEGVFRMNGMTFSLVPQNKYYLIPIPPMTTAIQQVIDQELASDDND